MKTAFITLTVAGGLLLSPGPAFGASHSSANYSIPADTIDAGGARTSSAKYTNDASLGAINGVAAANSASETNKAGYIGQLYEVTALIVSASSTNVYAGSNLQLNASARLDDGTILSLLTTQVVWSVVSGPIASINASGLATAGSVSQNTAATVRGAALSQSGTLQLMVLVVGSPGSPSSPRIMNFYLSGANMIVSGTNSVGGGNYYVLASTNVTLPLTNWTRVATNAFDSNGNFSFTNGISGSQPQRFYILQVP